MKIAVVGSRKGVEERLVADFIAALCAEDRTHVVVSGGAEGVDTWAEQYARQRGMTVISFRPAQTPGRGMEPSFIIEKWTLSGEGSSIEKLDVPTFADRASANWYRNWLIVEECERLVAFHANDSRGTQNALALANDTKTEHYRIAV